MLPSRAQVRLPGYDYSTPGAYFVTVCVKDKQQLLGSVRNGESRLSALGFLVQDHLYALPKHYANLALDCMVVMPNHIHATLFIKPLPKTSSDLKPAVLGTVVGCFKSGVVKQAKELGLLPGGLLWQPRYWDHIIRHERALQRIREYIVNNPRQWELDRENPERSGENEFYKWLEAYSSRVNKELAAQLTHQRSAS